MTDSTQTRTAGAWALALALLMPTDAAWAGATGGTEPAASTPTDVKNSGTCKKEETCPGKGMPTYSFMSLLAGLEITDVPVGYSPPVGPSVQGFLRYNQREVNQPAVFDVYNLGRNWSLGWLTWIQDNPGSPGSSVLRYVSGGGARTYSGYNAGTGAFAPETENASVLVRVSGAPVRYELRHADGSVDVFAQPDGRTSYPRKVLLTQKIDPQGNTLTLTYDTQNRLVSLTDAIGQVSALGYAHASDPLLVTSITDPFGRTASIGYDEQGRLNSITDVIGLTSTFTYDAGNFITSMSTPYGTTTFSQSQGVGNAQQRAIQATDPLGHTERMEYMPAAPGIAFSESRVPAGMPVFNAYLNYRNAFYWDKHMFAQACTGGASASATSCNYTKARINHFLHLAPSNTLTARVLESVKLPLESRIWYGYPGQSVGSTGTLDKPIYVGRVLDDGSTQLSTYAYNSRGHVTRQVDPDGRETRYTYDANQIDLIKVEQNTPGGWQTLAQYTYNSQHLPLSQVDAAGQTSTYTYNARGQRTSVTNPLGQVTQYTYDANGYLTTVINALGLTERSYTYDSAGRVASETDSEGYVLTYTYDALDRVVQVSHPDGTSRQIAWDKLDVASVTDRLGRTTRYNHDEVRNPVQVTDPLGQITRYTYYPNATLQTLTDGNGNVTTWGRDLESRVTSKTYADGTQTRTSYDTASRLSTTTDALNQTRRLNYSRANLLTGVSHVNALKPTPDVSWQYDSAYPRPTSMTDGLGTTQYSYVPVGSPGALQLAQDNGPYANDSITHGYDALGRVISTSIGNAANTQTITYDSLGRVSSKTNPLGSFAHQYLGQTAQITARQLAGGMDTVYRYGDNTQDRRLKAIVNLPSVKTKPSDGSAPRDWRYHSTAENLILGRKSNPGQPQGLHYDDAYRLIGTTQGLALGLDTDDFVSDGTVGTPNPGNWRSGYSYDSADNLTQASSESRPEGNWSATPNNLNQIASKGGNSWVYDAAGNLLDDGNRMYEWDAEQRLITLTDKATGRKSEFVYDGQSRLTVTKEYPAGSSTASETRYLWCGHKVCQARDGQDNVTARYFDEGEIKAGQSLYYTKDHLGSIMETTQASGRVLGSLDYGPYGEPEKAQGQLPDFRYAGMLHHAPTGLYLTHYRAYDPSVGRWLNRDPIEESGGINLYGYVGGNPVSYTDLSGLDAIKINYDYYPVDTGFGFKLPLGHAAVVTVDPKTGQTRYYEFGRYSDKECGNVRRMPVPNLTMGKSGYPTTESLEALYKYVSKNYGHGSTVTPTYYSDTDYDKANKYAEGFGKKHDCYSLTGNNCKTFAHDVATVGKK